MPRVPYWFRWLTIFSLSLIFLSGYFPVFLMPPIKQSLVQAASLQEQKNEVVSASFSKPLVLPHPGYLSTRFSAWHPGIDVATGLGMPIHPITEGVVTEKGTDFFGLGNYIVVSHQNDFKSKYAHMGKVFVKIGDKVSSDNILGEVGLTGHTSGPHTHLEITHNGIFVDPQKLLPELDDMPIADLAKK